MFRKIAIAVGTLLMFICAAAVCPQEQAKAPFGRQASWSHRAQVPATTPQTDISAIWTFTQDESAARMMTLWLVPNTTRFMGTFANGEATCKVSGTINDNIVLIFEIVCDGEPTLSLIGRERKDGRITGHYNTENTEHRRGTFAMQRKKQ